MQTNNLKELLKQNILYSHKQSRLNMGFSYINPFAFGVGAVGGWKELGRTTLGSPSETLDVTGLANKRYLMFLMHGIPNSTEYQTVVRVGNGSIDSGNNYAYRDSVNGAADGTTTSFPYFSDSGFTTLNDKFNVGYISNYSSKEKLIICQAANRNTAGAGNAPARKETVAKWTNTSNVIDQIRWDENGTGTHNTNSEVVILGYDPADTHTDNFWNSNGSATSTSGGSLDLVLTSSYKYNWFQIYTDFDANTNFGLRVGSGSIDTGSNYASRYSTNGSADGTTTSGTLGYFDGSSTGIGTTPCFTNIFCVNVSSKEKLFITHTVNQNTAGAGTAPQRAESVFKWTNTSNQFDRIQLYGNGQTIQNCQIVAWGAN